MLRKFSQMPFSLSKFTHAACAAMSVAAFMVVKPKLDASYLASLHPADYATGQLSFSGDLVKSYYAHMISTGTLDRYWQTQFIDFGFITAVFCLGLFFITGAARFSPPQSWGRRIGMISALSAMFGALADSLENLVSFVMLSNPTDFPNWIAVLGSTISMIKFTLISSAMFGCILAVLFAISSALHQKFRPI
jgi:hypothetical protein